MAGKGKKGREKYKLQSTATLPSGKPSKYFYTVELPKGAPKLELRKFDPRIRQYVLFKQTKLK